MNGWELRRQLTVVAAEHRAERDAAIALLEQAVTALAHGARVEPEGLREPVRHHLRATIERCQGARSLGGLPVNYALEMAAAILGAHNGQQKVVVGDGTGASGHQPVGD